MIQDHSNFSIRDFSGHTWRVCTSTSSGKSFVLEASSTVRMMGIIEASSSAFIANSIHEWEELFLKENILGVRINNCRSRLSVMSHL